VLLFVFVKVNHNVAVKDTINVPKIKSVKMAQKQNKFLKRAKMNGKDYNRTVKITCKNYRFCLTRKEKRTIFGEQKEQNI